MIVATRNPPLSSQEVDRLWDRYTKRRGVKLRNVLVEHYLYIARAIAWQFAERTPQKVTAEELESDAVLGLITAVERFDPSRGFQFSTYAGSRVRGAILDAIRNRDDTSRYVREQTRRYAEVENVLRAEEGRKPTREEVGERLDLSRQAFARVTRNQAKLTFSIDSRFFDKDGAAHSLEPIDDRDPFETVIRRDQVDTLLGVLPPKLRRVMRLHYVRGESAERIGRRYGVGPSRFWQQHRVAMALIRAAITRPGLEVA